MGFAIVANFTEALSMNASGIALSLWLEIMVIRRRGTLSFIELVSARICRASPAVDG